MPFEAPEYFGTADQQALLRRGAAAHLITRDDPRFSYYGRTVGVPSTQDAPTETVFALARLQGNSNFADMADDEYPDTHQAALDAGLSPMRYAKWQGDADALKAAHQITANSPLPDIYKMSQLSQETSPETRRSLATTCLSCGVLPPSLSVLTGAQHAAILLMALAADGTVVACAAAAAYLHRDHPLGKSDCWWGMLSVHPDHRGQALSLTLGARVILEMNAIYGFSRFMTGVEPGNGPSEAVSAKMGLSHEGRSILGVADPTLLAAGRMTK